MSLTTGPSLIERPLFLRSFRTTNEVSDTKLPVQSACVSHEAERIVEIVIETHRSSVQTLVLLESFLQIQLLIRHLFSRHQLQRQVVTDQRVLSPHISTLKFSASTSNSADFVFFTHSEVVRSRGVSSLLVQSVQQQL